MNETKNKNRGPRTLTKIPDELYLDNKKFVTLERCRNIILVSKKSYKYEKG